MECDRVINYNEEVKLKKDIEIIVKAHLPSKMKAGFYVTPPAFLENSHDPIEQRPLSSSFTVGFSKLKNNFSLLASRIIAGRGEAAAAEGEGEEESQFCPNDSERSPYDLNDENYSPMIQAGGRKHSKTMQYEQNPLLPVTKQVIEVHKP